MCLSLSDKTLAAWNANIAASHLLNGFVVKDVERFCVSGWAIKGKTLVKEEYLEFMPEKLAADHQIGKGCFHVAYKGVDANNVVWVFKKPLSREDLKDVVPDFLKQQLAYELAEKFTEEHCQQFVDQNVFLKYNKPYIATVAMRLKNGETVPMKGAFFEMEGFMSGTFQKFNAPNGAIVLGSGPLAPHRLPQAFSKWTYMVTSGQVMITDVQGCKLDRGQYWCTDPIVFTSGGMFGNVDPGPSGMNKFLRRLSSMESGNPELKALTKHTEQVVANTSPSKKKALSDRAVEVIGLADKALPGNMPEQVKRALRDAEEPAAKRQRC